MGFYRNYLWPRLMNWALRDGDVSEFRREFLRPVRGKVLEIGFGTGLNLPFYPPEVQELHIVDPNPGMDALAARRMRESPLAITRHVFKAEKLYFEDGTFDAAVTSFTLCSIPEVGLALAEIRRVLKSEGRFYFLEHGLSQEPRLQRWQRLLTPIQKRLSDGCHLDRPIDRLVETAAFRILDLKKFYHPKAPKFLGSLYQGIAEKSEDS